MCAGTENIISAKRALIIICKKEVVPFKNGRNAFRFTHYYIGQAKFFKYSYRKLRQIHCGIFHLLSCQFTYLKITFSVFLTRKTC